MEAEPAHTDYTGKRNNVSGSNRQYLDPNGSLHVGPHFCLHVWDPEQYPGEMIRSYRKAPLLIFTWFSVVVICKEPIGAWGSDHLITTLWVWLSTEVSMCVFAQVHVCVCVCVCLGYVLPRQSCRKKGLSSFNKATLGESSSDSARVCLLLLKTRTSFKLPPKQITRSAAQSLNHSVTLHSSFFQLDFLLWFLHYNSRHLFIQQCFVVAEIWLKLFDLNHKQVPIFLNCWKAMSKN